MSFDNEGSSNSLLDDWLLKLKLLDLPGASGLLAANGIDSLEVLQQCDEKDFCSLIDSTRRLKLGDKAKIKNAFRRDCSTKMVITEKEEVQYLKHLSNQINLLQSQHNTLSSKKSNMECIYSDSAKSIETSFGKLMDTISKRKIHFMTKLAECKAKIDANHQEMTNIVEKNYSLLKETEANCKQLIQIPIDFDNLQQRSQKIISKINNRTTGLAKSTKQVQAFMELESNGNLTHQCMSAASYCEILRHVPTEFDHVNVSNVRIQSDMIEEKSASGDVAAPYNARKDSKKLKASKTIVNKYGGYDLEMFVDKNKAKHFTCPLCQMIMKNATLVGCGNGHSFCKSCVHQFYDVSDKKRQENPWWYQKDRCPKCRKYLDCKDIDEDDERNVEILMLDVKCLKCNIWQGKLSKYKTHLRKECGKANNKSVQSVVASIAIANCNRASENMKIIVRSLEGYDIVFDNVSVKNKVSWVHHKIEEKEGTPVAEQRLVYRGRYMDRNTTLEEYQVRNESVIHLVFRCKGS